MGDPTGSVEAVDARLDGRYALRREIARGGMGAVYEAEHLFTARRVAIKLLHANALDGGLRERLIREARLLGTLRHPGVVEVLDAGVDPVGRPYVAMEMLEGRTLEGLLAMRGALPVADAVRVASQLCEALGAVHARGVVHRDVKPSNVFVVDDVPGRERVKLLDFGIAVEQPPLPSRGALRLTEAGRVVGTPEYMAPEQLMGGPIDARSDVYATAVTCFECLTARLPFEGAPHEIAAEVCFGEPAPRLRVLRPDAPIALEVVIARALAREPGARYDDAASFAHALREAVGDELPTRASADPPPHPRPARGARRVPYATQVDVYCPRHRVIHGCRSEDVSGGGMLLLGPAPCGEGEAVGVRFAMPASGQVVTLRAQVRWTRAARAGRALGLAFRGEPPEVRAAIDGYAQLAASMDGAAADAHG